MKNKKQTIKQEKNKMKRQFLLSFFSGKDKYEEKEVNGFWLIKQYNGDTEFWQVGIYSQESFKQYKWLKEQHQELFQQKRHIKSIIEE